jgi:hypothetical protein
MRRVIPFRINDQVQVQSVVGEIIASTDEFELSQDMVEVQLRNGLLVHLGWYPRGRVGNGGEYRIYVQDGLDQLLVPPFATSDPLIAAAELTEFVARWSTDWISSSASTQNSYSHFAAA